MIINELQRHHNKFNDVTPLWENTMICENRNKF
jgi:hypothetical protein